jgi:hypothetical protein
MQLYQPDIEYHANIFNMFVSFAVLFTINPTYTHSNTTCLNILEYQLLTAASDHRMLSSIYII